MDSSSDSAHIRENISFILSAKVCVNLLLEEHFTSKIRLIDYNNNKTFNPHSLTQVDTFDFDALIHSVLKYIFSEMMKWK